MIEQVKILQHVLKNHILLINYPSQITLPTVIHNMFPIQATDEELIIGVTAENKKEELGLGFLTLHPTLGFIRQTTWLKVHYQGRPVKPVSIQTINLDYEKHIQYLLIVDDHAQVFLLPITSFIETYYTNDPIFHLDSYKFPITLAITPLNITLNPIDEGITALIIQTSPEKLVFIFYYMQDKKPIIIGHKTLSLEKIRINDYILFYSKKDRTISLLLSLHPTLLTHLVTTLPSFDVLKSKNDFQWKTRKQIKFSDAVHFNPFIHITRNVTILPLVTKDHTNIEVLGYYNLKTTKFYMLKQIPQNMKIIISSQFFIPILHPQYKQETIHQAIIYHENTLQYWKYKMSSVLEQEDITPIKIYRKHLEDISLFTKDILIFNDGISLFGIYTPPVYDKKNQLYFIHFLPVTLVLIRINRYITTTNNYLNQILKDIYKTESGELIYRFKRLQDIKAKRKELKLLRTTTKAYHTVITRYYEGNKKQEILQSLEQIKDMINEINAYIKKELEIEKNYKQAPTKNIQYKTTIQNPTLYYDLNNPKTLLLNITLLNIGKTPITLEKYILEINGQEKEQEFTTPHIIYPEDQTYHLTIPFKLPLILRDELVRKKKLQGKLIITARATYSKAVKLKPTTLKFKIETLNLLTIKAIQINYPTTTNELFPKQAFTIHVRLEALQRLHSENLNASLQYNAEVLREQPEHHNLLTPGLLINEKNEFDLIFSFKTLKPIIDTPVIITITYHNPSSKDKFIITEETTLQILPYPPQLNFTFDLRSLDFSLKEPFQGTLLIQNTGKGRAENIAVEIQTKESFIQYDEPQPYFTYSQILPNKTIKRTLHFVPLKNGRYPIATLLIRYTDELHLKTYVETYQLPKINVFIQKPDLLVKLHQVNNSLIESTNDLQAIFLEKNSYIPLVFNISNIGKGKGILQAIKLKEGNKVLTQNTYRLIIEPNETKPIYLYFKVSNKQNITIQAEITYTDYGEEQKYLAKSNEYTFTITELGQEALQHIPEWVNSYMQKLERDGYFLVENEHELPVLLQAFTRNNVYNVFLGNINKQIIFIKSTLIFKELQIYMKTTKQALSLLQSNKHLSLKFKQKITFSEETLAEIFSMFLVNELQETYQQIILQDSI